MKSFVHRIILIGVDEQTLPFYLQLQQGVGAKGAAGAEAPPPVADPGQ